MYNLFIINNKHASIFERRGNPNVFVLTRLFPFRKSVGSKRGQIKSVIRVVLSLPKDKIFGRVLAIKSNFIFVK